MQNINKIAGVDEVGRGSLAGPVFAAAVILNNKINTKDIKFSYRNSSFLENEILIDAIFKCKNGEKEMILD